MAKLGDESTVNVIDVPVKGGGGRFGGSTETVELGTSGGNVPCDCVNVTLKARHGTLDAINTVGEGRRGTFNTIDTVCDRAKSSALTNHAVLDCRQVVVQGRHALIHPCDALIDLLDVGSQSRDREFQGVG